MRLRFACLSGLAFATAASSDASAQVSIAGDVTTESFAGFTGGGFAPTPAAGQLDSDAWRSTGMSEGACAFGATCTGGDFARGSSVGDVTGGGFYAFDTSAGNPGLGFQASSNDMDPGTIVLRLVNNTGATISAASFEYTFLYFNDQGSSQSLDFAFSTDDATYSNVAALSDDTPATAGAAVWTSVRLRRTITGLDIPDGGSLFFRWSTATTGSGTRDEVAIDDITVRLGCGNGVVEGTEACDDFNNAAGDGCTADCTATEAGWDCSGNQPTVCTDVDECAAATDTCVANSTCANTPGSYDCPCDAGYQGDGQVACTDIDECAAGTDACDDNATCSNTVGDHDCTCNQGWEGSGETCADIDECQAGTHDCGSADQCINLDGSWDCACDNGYDWTGAECVDVDECTEGLAACDANATCDNFAGGFSCDCNAGYEGDGLSCTATDTDGDDIPFSEDNCPGDPNPGQEDSDGDGRGDACDYVDDNASGEDEGGCGCRAAAPGSTLATLVLLGLALLPIRRRRR
jgi:MYXO-CTERM domain-containing protein